MRKTIAAILPYFLAIPLSANFTNKTTWDVRTTGNDLNGGGFDTSSAGTDRSQQDGPYITIDGTTCTASVTGATPSVMTLSSCTPAPSSADAGNVVNISGGSAITGRYRIASVSGSDWTLDRNACASGSCTAIGRMGGGLATVAQAVSMFVAAAGGVADMTVWVKSGTYSPYASTITLAAPTGQNANHVVGYKTTHGDHPLGTDKPVIQLTSGSSGFSATTSTGGWVFEDVVLDAGGTATVPLSMSNVFLALVTSVVKNSTGNCISSTGTVQIYFNIFTGCNGGSGVFMGGGIATAIGNTIYDNLNSVAFFNVSIITAIGNVMTNNGAGSGAAFRATNWNHIRWNTVYHQAGNAVTGIGSGFLGLIRDNVFACSGGYGISVSSAAPALQPLVDYNGYHANGSGNTQNVNAGSNDRQIGAPGSACATNNPFVNPVPSGLGDFSLNGTPGAGPVFRGAGYQATDLGAVQSLGGTGGSYTFVQ